MKLFLKYIAFAFGILFFFNANAQSPDLINYQAVARDLSGNPLVSTAVNITYDIRQSSAIGSIIYSETHNLTTNQFGLFTAKIGGGTPVTGTFSGINWSTGLYYLQVTVNGDVMAATQLLSVPYALHANTATSGVPGANGHANLADSLAEPAGVNCANGGYLIHMGADDNDNNILEPLERDISYYICNGLDGTANNNDTSATNEIQTLSISNDTVFLSKGGLFVVLPAALGDNWGSQVVISSGTNISGDGTTGNPLMVNDSVDDADNDPNNERITTFALNPGGDSLIIVEAGVGHAFPLSNLDDGDWKKGTGADIFNNSDSVGIATNNPKSLFQIGSNMHLFPFSFPGPEEYAVTSYNAHHTGLTIKNTTGGVSGFSFIGHKIGQPNYGVHLFAPQPIGTDMTLFNPLLQINLSGKGLGVNTDSPKAGIDVEPIDSAGIIIRMADNGSTANLFFEDTQNRTVGFKAPTSLTNNYGLTLPVNLPTASGSSLVSDLAGNLSWGAPTASFWTSTNLGSFHPTTLSDKIGIGIINPASKLNIVAPVNTSLLLLEGSGFVGGGLHFTYKGTTEGYEIRADDQGGINMEASGNHKISFETSGSERMRITGPGRVGIGTATPSEKLDVNGDVIANNYKYATPKARFLTIGESDFRLGRSSAGEIESYFGQGGVGVVNATGTNTLVAPVYLPHGAVVTNIQVFYVDNSNASMDFNFISRGLSATARSIISTVTSVGNTPGVQSINLTGTVINNQINSYAIHIYSTGWSTNNTKTMDIKTVQISYTITETD